jgi:hypothetical protein
MRKKSICQEIVINMYQISKTKKCKCSLLCIFTIIVVKINALLFLVVVTTTTTITTTNVSQPYTTISGTGKSVTEEYKPSE